MEKPYVDISPQPAEQEVVQALLPTKRKKSKTKKVKVVNVSGTTPSITSNIREEEHKDPISPVKQIVSPVSSMVKSLASSKSSGSNRGLKKMLSKS